MNYNLFSDVKGSLGGGWVGKGQTKSSTKNIVYLSNKEVAVLKL